MDGAALSAAIAAAGVSTGAGLTASVRAVPSADRQPHDSQPPGREYTAGLRCPVCDGACEALGAVDFNKNCEEARGLVLPPAGRLVGYARCRQCGHVFAPEFHAWTPEDFRREIYNDGYLQVDPDHVEARPCANADNLLALFGERGRAVRHLDYGGGAGRLSELLRESGWQSVSVDPFFDAATAFEGAGRFGLITCFEVFEHVPDARQLLARLDALLAPDGLILVSTLLSDGEIAAGRPLEWWYLAPRNGHISLFSRRSLAVLAVRQGLQTASMSALFHFFWRRQFPSWASHLLQPG